MEVHAEYEHEVTIEAKHYVQLTYGWLNAGPNGDMVAYLDADSDCWHLSNDYLRYLPEGAANEFSDVVIWTEED